MKKKISLIKASFTNDMSLFKINVKNNSLLKRVLPFILAFIIMGSVYFYADALVNQLIPLQLGFVMLTLFIMVTSILTLIEGIYKTSSLLFNLKDDNLLLSLPISRKTVLFIRILKFYIFELLYNSIFLLPAIVCYIVHFNPSFSFYIVSIISLFIFPIVPILLSCFIGVIISYFSSKFKRSKNFQTIITIIFLMVFLIIYYNANNFINSVIQNASNINDVITKIYYPAGAYISLIRDFNIWKLFIFIIVHVIIFTITIMLIGKIYFNINSQVKSIRVSKSKKEYKIRKLSVIRSLISKEFKRFITSTVFVVNAGFGLVIYILISFYIALKFDGLVSLLHESNIPIDINFINQFIPIIILGLICFTGLMTSITSSMISLEGKSFVILKSLPIKPIKIIMAKIWASILISFPCLLIGDLILFIKFKLDLLTMFFLLIASFIIPLVSSLIGIIVNLKYPKMDASNDTEVVKQSVSSMISVFIGMGLIALTIFGLYKGILSGLSNSLIIIIIILVYLLISILLLAYLYKTCDRHFNNITI